MGQNSKENDSTKWGKKPIKQPRKITPRYLENAALAYLQRYATSSENLKTILCRKIDRSCAFHGQDAGEFYGLVDKLVERYIASGLLNDAQFAQGRVATLRRQGRSKSMITQKLTQKGLSKSDISTALESVDAENPSADAELAAARALAKKKKIGPWRGAKAADAKALQKELAVLGRAGFSYDTARRALEFKSDEED